MKALEIIAMSWPIAAMFVAFCAAITIYTLIRRVMKDSHEERMERLNGNNAVVVQRRRDED